MLEKLYRCFKLSKVNPGIGDRDHTQREYTLCHQPVRQLICWTESEIQSRNPFVHKFVVIKHSADLQESKQKGCNTLFEFTRIQRFTQDSMQERNLKKIHATFNRFLAPLDNTVYGVYHWHYAQQLLNILVVRQDNCYVLLAHEHEQLKTWNELHNKVLLYTRSGANEHVYTIHTRFSCRMTFCIRRHIRGLKYCKSGNFRATFIFALFTLQPGCGKIKARKYVHFALRSM